jgi:probable rRNA maturation factor
VVMHEINIHIDPEFKLSIKKRWVKGLVANILDALKISIPTEIGIVITGNKRIQMLNREYRDKDQPTDVLSFTMLAEEGGIEQDLPFVPAPDGVSHLGEIVISYHQALLQANERGHAVEHEITLLLIHGMLHLAGYDHEKSAIEERRMKRKEKAVLSMVVPQSD